MSTPVPLEAIQIARPCPAEWDRMLGDDRVRYCTECRLNVYNLSAMTRADAEALIQAKEGRMCIRFYRRADGTVLTADCPIGWAAVRRRGVMFVGAVAGFLIGLFGLLMNLHVIEAYRRGESVGVREVEPLRALLERLNPKPAKPPVPAFFPPPGPAFMGDF